jgi:hypothetical protein
MQSSRLLPSSWWWPCYWRRWSWGPALPRRPTPALSPMRLSICRTLSRRKARVSLLPRLARLAIRKRSWS